MCSQRTLILAAVLGVFVTGCVRNNPVFRELAKREDAKHIKWSDEQIAKSPDLQELDRLCTKTIPLFVGFVPSARFAGPTGKTSLTYYYRSSAKFVQVKSFYIDYFSRNGWVLARQKENGWGPDELEFAKQLYRIIISHGGLGDADYAIGCIRLSGSDQAASPQEL